MNEHSRTRVHPLHPKPTQAHARNPSALLFPHLHHHHRGSSSKTEGKHQTAAAREQAAEAIIKVAEAGIKSEKGFY
jgi:hypothetical protein